MKTITIHLTQEQQAGLFRVTKFTNTMQLAIGAIVKADDVSRWCATPRINVYVDGMTAVETDDETPVLDDGKDSIRHDALATPGYV